MYSTSAIQTSAIYNLPRGFCGNKLMVFGMFLPNSVLLFEQVLWHALMLCTVLVLWLRELRRKDSRHWGRGLKLRGKEETTDRISCSESDPQLLICCKLSYPCNRPWRPIGLWDIEASTFSRQSSHRWQWGCQPHAPATLYPHEDSWYAFLLEAESTAGP
jgi:hypothetical protein